MNVQGNGGGELMLIQVNGQGGGGGGVTLCWLLSSNIYVEAFEAVKYKWWCQHLPSP